MICLSIKTQKFKPSFEKNVIIYESVKKYLQGKQIIYMNADMEVEKGAIHMQIAICDDNIYLGNKIESLVDRAFAGNNQHYSCEVFLSGDELLAYLAENPLAFQMYLLDIEMEGTDGLQAAAKIRETDKDAIIIFMTSHAELMPEAFKVLAFQYIVKPFDDEKTIALLLAAVRHLQSMNTLYQYTVRKTRHTVYLSQIEYIESIGRKVVLHMKDGGQHEYYGTLKEAAEKAAGISFTQVHNSYIINMQHLAEVSSGSVKMQGGMEIPISGKYHDEFHRAYRKYVLAISGV